MKTPLPLSAIAFFTVFFVTNSFSRDVVEVAPAASSSSGPTTIYRQVLPDGRIVYSDKAVKNGKVDHTITVAPPIKGNLWTTEPAPRPNIAPQIERTQIIKAPAASPAERKKIAEQAAANVIRAEMLLEDAKRKQEDGFEPLAGERTGNIDGKSRLNEAYEARQKLLAKNVAYADAALKRALAAQSALR